MKYYNDYKTLHQQGAFAGNSLAMHENSLAAWLDHHKIRTLLDYGCGKAMFWNNSDRKQKYDVNLTLYDPAVPSYDTLPSGKFDGVVCSDVLEHIPQEELDETIDRLFSYAKKALFLTVCCRAAKKMLPSGVNAHVTIMDMPSWRRLISHISRKYPSISVTLIENK